MEQILQVKALQDLELPKWTTYEIHSLHYY